MGMCFTSYTISVLARFLHCPSKIHMVVAKRVLRYLNLVKLRVLSCSVTQIVIGLGHWMLFVFNIRKCSS